MIIIDRFEGEHAVLEIDDNMVTIDRALIPKEAEEGDVLYISENGYIIDSAATEARRAAMRERLNRLRGNG